jgi:glycine/D-amino acid oxidase-like deaminating enzyme
LPEFPTDFPFVIDFTQSLYFHPEGPGLLTGMSNPEEISGYDQTVDSEWELVHLEAAINRLPLLERAGLASRMAGLYEVTPDAHPILAGPGGGYFIVTSFPAGFADRWRKIIELSWMVEQPVDIHADLTSVRPQSANIMWYKSAL